jgi:hypothetical protein
MCSCHRKSQALARRCLALDIWGIIVKPLTFDPARRYPVIENIYAGPHDSFVPKTFWPFGPFAGGDKVMGMQANAEMGFSVQHPGGDARPSAGAARAGDDGL